MRKPSNLLCGPRYRGWALLNTTQRKAVLRLARALKDWPEGIDLLGWSGTFVVTLRAEEASAKGEVVSVASFLGVHCEGGDPYEYQGPLSIEDTT